MDVNHDRGMLEKQEREISYPGTHRSPWDRPSSDGAWLHAGKNLGMNQSNPSNPTAGHTHQGSQN